MIDDARVHAGDPEALSIGELRRTCTDGVSPARADSSAGRQTR
jgi:hypothetical protein